ncbi:hypothetical protein [Viridibacterium curvum]|uniref:Uncharacterized protein n=1 Tax=Viridibacterium curvum TaxID=1101404 RepID=A0ABP9QLQ0_9RHOO
MNRTAPRTTQIALIALLLTSTSVHADTKPTTKPPATACCRIDDRAVSATQFDAFVRELKTIPGTQLNAESPRGLYASYKASAPNGKKYLVTLDGTRRTARQMPER